MNEDFGHETRPISHQQLIVAIQWRVNLSNQATTQIHETYAGRHWPILQSPTLVCNRTVESLQELVEISRNVDGFDEATSSANQGGERKASGQRERDTGVRSIALQAQQQRKPQFHAGFLRVWGRGSKSINSSVSATRRPPLPTLFPLTPLPLASQD